MRPVGEPLHAAKSSLPRVQAGHTFEVLEDAETVEFSPMTEYKRHMQMVVLSAAGSREKR